MSFCGGKGDIYRLHRGIYKEVDIYELGKPIRQEKPKRKSNKLSSICNELPCAFEGTHGEEGEACFSSETRNLITMKVIY